MSEKRFADIASFQPSSRSFIQAIKDAGASGVVIKLTEGTYYTNPKASEQVKNAQAVGLVTSAYHFWRATSVSSAKAEAEYFLKQVQALGINKNAVLINDYEASPASAAALNAFYEPLKAAGYNKVGIYFPGSWYSSGRLNGVTGLKWLAEYGVSSPRAKLDAWQYSSTTKIQGANVDFSIDYTGAFTDPNATGGSSQTNDQRADADKNGQAGKTDKQDCYSLINMMNNDLYDKFLH